jgi:DNA-binding XRE family transcriptional regulator
MNSDRPEIKWWRGLNDQYKTRLIQRYHLSQSEGELGDEAIILLYECEGWPELHELAQSAANPFVAIDNILDNLRLSRKRAGYTLEEVGNILGYGKSYLSMIENGKRPKVSYELAKKLYYLYVNPKVT